jgi:two-component system chemotaxis response regulator CheB
MRGSSKEAGRAPRVVVIGASAGGYEAIGRLAAELPAKFRAAVFVVLHTSSAFDAASFVTQLRSRSELDCKLAENGERFRAGCMYVARPDTHLLVKGAVTLVTKGARENRYRPAIDPLFRSAAVNHGARVIGVVLTGMLDDGTAGLDAVRRCGGITVVQDPEDATFPEMPESAMKQLDVDHVSTLANMGALLERLVNAPPPKSKRAPKDIVTEAIIAERVLSDVHAVQSLGEQVPYNCPECGGVLWQMSQPAAVRYRCHTGHAFTASSLSAAQSEKIEETLWFALRMLEERRNLFDAMNRKRQPLMPSALERARETETHIARIRMMLGASSTRAVTKRGRARTSASD